jgi:propanediol dehydratase large subunit
VARNAPFNALAILVGTQTGRGGVLTQCAVEEALGLRIAMKGLTTYAETLSVYGTERAFTDGDDTPWSKAFLAAAYASRGVKVRFTSGTGSEALMGHAERCSMLYLEARCLLVTKGAGSQGVQNGSISCIALPESLPGGVRAVLAENLLAAMLGLECASGNDALASHSTMRKSAKLMLQFIPGTDFICSGYSAIPKRDNLFGGGNFDAEDFDDWNVLQRDMQVDGGVLPITEDAALAIRERAARAIQAVYAELGFPPIRDDEVAAATTAHSSDDMLPRDAVADLAAADRFLASDAGMLAVADALRRHGFADVAANVLEMGRQRLAGDYLQPAAIFQAARLDAGDAPNVDGASILSGGPAGLAGPKSKDAAMDGGAPASFDSTSHPSTPATNDVASAQDACAERQNLCFHVLSAINDPNDYTGPGTGYRLEGERWAAIRAIHQAQSPRQFVAPHTGAASPKLVEIGPARASTRPEIIVAVGPGFNGALTRTIGGLEHEAVLAAILSGVADEGLTARIVKVYRSSDLAAIGYAGAEVSGSGIAVGLQSRGTAVIHKRGLARLNNLELFPQSPSLTLETYRAIGRNAARYAKNIPPVPVGVKIDNWARLRLIVKTSLLHRRETDEIADKPPQELWFDWEPD